MCERKNRGDVVEYHEYIYLRFGFLGGEDVQWGLGESSFVTLNVIPIF